VAYTNASLCLGADAYDGAPAQLMRCADKRAKLRRAASAIAFDGFCLDVRDGMTAMQAWSCVGNANQAFEWSRVRGAALVDTIGWRGRCMGVTEVREGAPVAMGDCGGMGARWIGLDSATGW
jgi:hypothetical protein